MKRFLFPITFSLLVLFSFGCKKKLFDSRKKYEGTWEITLTNVTTTFSTDTAGNPMTNENTYIFVQEVEISIDESDENGLIFLFPINAEKKVSLTNGNTFQKGCGSSSVVIAGQFKSKKEFTMTMSNFGHCNGYSAGGYSNQTITGTKK